MIMCKSLGTLGIVGMCMAVLLPSLLHAEEGLLVHYAFDEGTGAVLHDKSGGGHNGTIKGGASWAKGLSFGALSFNGTDAYVEGPADLTIGKAGTLEVWCHPLKFGGGLVSWHYDNVDAPKPLALYFDIYTFNSLVGAMSDLKNQDLGNADIEHVYSFWHAASSALVQSEDIPADMLNRWSHIVMKFNDQNVQLFRNGRLRGSKPSFFSPDTKGVPMRIGRGARLPYFDGMIAEVRVYNRALSDSEIAAHFAEKAPVFQPHLPRSLTIVPRLYAAEGKLAVEVDLTDLSLSGGGTIESQLLSGSTVLHKVTQPIAGNVPAGNLAFPTRELAVGDYEIRCTVRNESGESLVETSRRWRMPKLAAPGVRVLNNLVAELLDVKDLAVLPEQELSFMNPRKGWVFISCAADLREGDTVSIAADGAADGAAIKMTAGGPAPGETMCLLPEGAGKLQINCQGKPVIRELIVRSIPELMFCGYPAPPHVAAYGDYDFDFLKKDVLPNVNTIVAGCGWAGVAALRWPEDRKKAYNMYDLWKNTGRRWLHEYPIIYPDDSKTLVTADQAFDWWAKSDGFTDPDFSGVVADEFGLGADGPTDTEPYRDYRYRTAPYTEAVRRIAAVPEFKDRAIYAWCGGLDRAETRSKEFVNTVLSTGGKLCVEEYLAEPSTEQVGRDVLYHGLRTKTQHADANFPGLMENLIFVPGIGSAPPESNDVDPQVDYKVWMDMQMHYLATSPDFFGLAGIMWYKLSYADEEAVRWMGRLFRHYAIEGKTEPLSGEYGFKYKLDIVQNADFDEGLSGWTADPAETDSIRTGKLDNLGLLQGRGRRQEVGRNYLLTRRCADRPNTVSQVIQKLSPGKLYSVRMMVSDYKAISERVEGPHSMNARMVIDQAEMIPDKSFVYGIWSFFGPYFFDFHRLVFRANGPTAKLTISDWSADGVPGGPVGQELMFNFIEVQPYFE